MHGWGVPDPQKHRGGWRRPVSRCTFPVFCARSHLIAPEVPSNYARGGNGGAQEMQNEAKFWEGAACPMPTYKLRRLAGRGSGGQPARDAAQRAACSGLALPRAALRTGVPCPASHWCPVTATAIPVTAAARAEGERGLVGSPGCLSWGCPAAGAEQLQPCGAARPRPNAPPARHISVTRRM